MKLEAARRLTTELHAGISPVVYHITGTRSAASILNKDRFELKPAEGTETEESTGKSMYYLSTTRMMGAAYTRSTVSQNSVLLVLNGTKLQQRYKGESVDYWGPEFYKGEGGKAKQFEAEDRVYSNTPFIPRASNYIMEVHAVINDQQAALFAIRKACLIHKIKLFFYNDPNDLMTINKKKAVEYKPLPAPEVTPEPSEYRYKYKLRKNSLSKWIALYEMPARGTDNERYAQITKAGEDVLKAYRALRDPSALRLLDADMHNAKSTPYEDLTKEREALDRLIKIMRTNRWSPDAFLKAMRTKWYG
jgi:hypothetical protein